MSGQEGTSLVCCGRSTISDGCEALSVEYGTQLLLHGLIFDWTGISPTIRIHECASYSEGGREGLLRIGRTLA